MEITTKYAIGDKVWAVVNRRARCLTVRTIQTMTSLFDEGQTVTSVVYGGADTDELFGESDVFATKEELLNSL